MNSAALNGRTPSSPTGEPCSPVTHVWKPDLYKLQQDAPRPKKVECVDPVLNCPPYYGSEFHGLLSQKDASTLLVEEGSYLVRQSKNSDFYTLSLRIDGNIKHFKLYYDGLHFVKEKRFATIEELVADGLVTMYIEERAGPFIERMYNLSSYEKSPYMTLNKLKRRAVIARSRSLRYPEQLAAADGYFQRERSVVTDNAGVPTSPTPSEEAVEYAKPHNFKTHTFKGLNWCEFCGNFLWGFTAQGVKCDDCGFSAHSRCSQKVPSDCCPDLKQLRGVFGIDLTTLVKAHHTTRPFIIDKCITEIEKRGLDAEGLYRVSGFAEEIEMLKMELDRDGEQADIGPDKYENINVIAGTLKLYLRLLPIPLITFDAQPALTQAAQGKTVEEQKRGLKDALTLLPAAHYNTLKFLMEHLNRVVAHQAVNKMTSHNLSTVFAPTLMPPPRDLTKCVGLPGMTYEISALEKMITHQQEIFD